MNEKPSLEIGHHRPVYLWAGQATVRMNRLKFMNAPVDVMVHNEAHEKLGALRMAKEAACNWAYLMYNWGFPPEIEKPDREDFRKAVRIFRAEGIKVFGYVQSSNCVYDGSFKEKDWYAIDPQGKRFHYYTGRLMTCWSHPAWQEYLQNIVLDIVESGADGVFFDNLWFGTNPMHFLGAWMGSAGCYCTRCQNLYRKHNGCKIPVRIAPNIDISSREYLRWRARQVTQMLSDLCLVARSQNPNIIISANDYDPVMRPSYLVYGVDLQALAQIQDVIMIEDFALPYWGKNQLINNALTLRTARAFIGDKPLSTISYDKGIGFDEVYSPRRFTQTIAEAAACGSAAVVKGTEYFNENTFTLLTAEQFAPQRLAVGRINKWLETNATLFHKRVNAARIGLLHPGEKLYWHWNQLAPLYFGVGQSLLVAGIPWRVVTPEDNFGELDILLTFEESCSISSVKTIFIPELPGWEPQPLSFWDKHSHIHTLASNMVRRLYRTYFKKRWFRKVGDWMGITSLYMASPMLTIPTLAKRQSLLENLPSQSIRVKSETPVLVEYWKQDKEYQLHLVNYASEPTQISITFENEVQWTVLSSENDEVVGQGTILDDYLDVYKIYLWQKTSHGNIQ